MEEEVPKQQMLESSMGDGLSRQVTLQLSQEQYDRLFFAPNVPRGDLSRRLGNPTLFGLMGFLIPFTSTVLILCTFAGSEAPTSLVGLDGDYFMIGGIAMILAGIFDWVLGNSWPASVFIIYGCHWASLAYQQAPTSDTLAGFIGADGATTLKTAAITHAYQSSQAFHNVTMTIISFVFFIGSLRVNVFFNIIFSFLVVFFASLAAANFAVPTATTAADAQHILNLIHVAGAFGFVVMLCGWYLAIVTVCAAVDLPCPLPVFDLSQRVFPKKPRAHEAV